MNDKPDPSPPVIPLDYAARGVRNPKTPLGRRTRVVLAVLYLLAVLLLLVFALLPPDMASNGPQGELATVAILRPTVGTYLPLIPLLGVILLLAANIILLSRKRILWGILLSLVTGAVALVALGMVVVRSLGPWTLCDEVTASDGQQYCFIDSSFLQGQTMAISRVTSSGLLYKTMKVVGTTNGDSPRSFLRVVRPLPLKPAKYGTLYTTPGGLIAGLRNDNDCYVVYDIAAQRFYGHGDVEKLSPLLLLDAKSLPYTPDQASVGTPPPPPASMDN